jgi:YHS domain-containing protein
MLTRFVLYAVVALLLYRALRSFLRGVLQGAGAVPGPRKKPPIAEGVRMVRDPVCGTYVIPANALAVRDAEGMHHFCSATCRDAFTARAAR